MYIVLYCENVMSLRLFERLCWLPYFEKYKLTVYTGFGICPVCNCYAVEIL